MEVHSISSDDTSEGKEVVDAEVASTAKQPALTSGEGIAHVSCGIAGVTQRGSLCSPSRTWTRGGTRAPSSNFASWRSGRYRRRCPWWPTNCPESPRFVFSFLA